MRLRSVVVPVVVLCTSGTGCLPCYAAQCASPFVTPALTDPLGPVSEHDPPKVGGGGAPGTTPCGRSACRAGFSCVHVDDIEGGLCRVSCNVAHDQCPTGTRCTAVRGGRPICADPRRIPPGGFVAEGWTQPAPQPGAAADPLD